MLNIRRLPLAKVLSFARPLQFSFCLKNKSSKEIESQMKLQGLKNQQKLKSLISLNPTKPTLSKQGYEKPKFIKYNMDTLREYSHKYPEFLVNELQNSRSQFHEVISQRIEQLWAVDKSDGIELILFLDGWGFQQNPIIPRWAQNQDFTLDQMFKLLKTNFKFADIFENKLIIKLKDSLPLDQYGSLFKVLNFYRLKGYGNDSFYKAMEQHFVANIKNLSASNTTILLIHYANNANETMDSRLKIMNIVEERIYAVSKFLNADELISVLYCYLKTGTATDTLLQQIEQRIVLNIAIFKPEQLIRLLTLCCSLPRRIPIVFHNFCNYLNKDKLHFSILPTLYKISGQHSLANNEFLQKIEPLLIQNIHNYTPEQVADCCWGFAVVDPIQQKKLSKLLGGRKSPNAELFYKKVEEIIQGGLRDYNVRQVTKIAWAMMVKEYSPQGEFWKQIQSWLHEQLVKKDATVKDAALVMWAYANQRPLLGSTLKRITEIVLQNWKKMDQFDLTTTCWFYSTLSGLPEVKIAIAKTCYIRFVQIFDEMDILEILKCLRWFIQIASDVQYDIKIKFLQRVQKYYLTYSYPILVNIMIMLPRLTPQKEKPKYQPLLVKIYQRIQELKRVKPIDEQQVKESVQAELENQAKVKKQRQEKKKIIEKQMEEREKQQQDANKQKQQENVQEQKKDK